MNVARIELVAALAVSLFLIGCQGAPAPEAESTPKISFGDGDANWIVTEHARREGATFTFSAVDFDPAAGDMFLVMLHRDVNENREFDFVFVDERNVVDAAVFEGTKMIAHPIAAP
jgi:hypothetical protein